jgi:mevalonate kinase
MYPSKILLFGEYSILFNSHALAIPYNKFNGEWAFMEDKTNCASQEAYHSNHNLQQFLTYIRSGEKHQNKVFLFDIMAFEKDLGNGLYFKSTIPNGAGLGSSGALVAAIFDRCVHPRTISGNISDLKNYLASLESFYHLSSSGIDPLVSYLKSPVLLTGKEKIEKCNFSVNHFIEKSGLFLVNSRYLRNTGKLVNYFKNKCNTNRKYFNNLHEEYIPVNNECVQECISHDHSERLFSKIKVLTQLQLNLFKEMIPEKFIPVIKYGLETDLFYLKLCGSGGGGYFLGFTKDTLKTKLYFKENGNHTFNKILVEKINCL